MTTTYTWIINSLERTIENGIVSVVHYDVHAEDENNKARFYASITLSAPEEGSEIIPYEDLTESLCCDWVKSALGEQEVTDIEANLQNQLDVLSAPVTETGTPW